MEIAWEITENNYFVVITKDFLLTCNKMQENIFDKKFSSIKKVNDVSAINASLQYRLLSH